MWRHCAICGHCGFVLGWRRDGAECRQEILRHMAERHALTEAGEPGDYRLVVQRQCDYCLEPYLDDCTKCRHDFCSFHAGDIDGLCGGCI